MCSKKRIGVSQNALIITIVVVIAIVLISLFVVMVNLQKTVVVHVKDHDTQGNEARKNKTTIEELLEIASRRSTSRNDLTAAILKVSKECPFPSKIKGLAPKNAKMYLNFILLVASHKNADAKLIAFMDEELKKTNPEYKTEIDIYENEGIHQRSNRL